MKPANVLSYHIRKWYTIIDDTLANETGELAADQVLRKVVVAAVVENPYAGRFSIALDQIVGDSAALGEQFGERLVDGLGGIPAQSYGKACIVGVGGEYEHGNAFLTTVFADPVREALGGGKAWIASTGKRGALGTTIDVPLAHKDALYVRSHYDTVSVSFADAPAPDEVIVIMAAATRGRIKARLGGLSADQARGDDGLR